MKQMVEWPFRFHVMMTVRVIRLLYGAFYSREPIDYVTVQNFP